MDILNSIWKKVISGILQAAGTAKAAYRKCPATVKTTAAVAAVCAVIFMTLPISLPQEESIELPPPAAVDSTITPAPTLAAEPTPKPSVEPLPNPQDESPAPDTAPEPPRTMLPHLEELYKENSDLAGWLKIEGTQVDYPVMYTPDNPGFYLTRTFEKEDDPTGQGTLFIDENCTLEPRSANLIIHGHNMKNGTMFGNLSKYKNKSHFEKYPVFEFSTLYDTAEYEIVSVFLSRIYRRSDDVFKFYQFFDAGTEDEFDYYIDNIKALSLYDTGVSAQFGDTLITLTTCEYSQDNGRLVVVGRLVFLKGEHVCR